MVSILALGGESEETNGRNLRKKEHRRKLSNKDGKTGSYLGKQRRRTKRNTRSEQESSLSKKSLKSEPYGFISHLQHALAADGLLTPDILATAPRATSLLLDAGQRFQKLTTLEFSPDPAVSAKEELKSWRDVPVRSSAFYVFCS